MATPSCLLGAEGLCKQIVEESAAKQPGAQGQPALRPAYTTVFYWMEFVCKRGEALLTQVQRELVQEKKRGKEMPQLPDESVVENPNAYKAGSVRKQSMLNLSSFLTHTARVWLREGKQVWYRLRAYCAP